MIDIWIVIGVLLTFSSHVAERPSGVQNFDPVRSGDVGAVAEADE